MDDRSNGLLAWQWSLYADGHQDRKNLMLHVLTVPLFMSGTLALLAAPFAGVWLAPGGVVAMAVAMALQGRGHRREATRPVRFRGAFDVVARIFVEQWVSFPRYVASGRFSRAWRAASLEAPERTNPPVGVRARAPARAR